jgi:hypothetical protein
MRYKLMSKFPNETEEVEVNNKRKNTKAEVEAWMQDCIKAYGLDWRAGFTIKFRNSECVYTWRWIKDDSILKP